MWFLGVFGWSRQIIPHIRGKILVVGMAMALGAIIEWVCKGVRVDIGVTYRKLLGYVLADKMENEGFWPVSIIQDILKVYKNSLEKLTLISLSFL